MNKQDNMSPPEISNLTEIFSEKKQFLDNYYFQNNYYKTITINMYRDMDSNWSLTRSITRPD